MTSPVRISERFRDSSKRAAKDSDIQFPNFVGQAASCFVATVKKLDRLGLRQNRGWVKQPEHQCAKQRERDDQERVRGGPEPNTCLLCHQANTCATDSSMESRELSRCIASAAGFKGATLRCVSRASRASKSARRAEIVVEKPFEISCL
jgi:hypothetical protein